MSPAPLIPAPLILVAENWQDYQLLDSGNGQKLEQVGAFRFIRPEPQALWQATCDINEWTKSDGEFVSSADGRDGLESGKWSLASSVPQQWQIQYDGLAFHAMPTPFRHLGFFPEQSAHWNWCATKIENYVKTGKDRPKILNLFGYSGVASTHAARAGAEVTHVDGSKKAIAQAFANRDCAGMGDAPIRFITEDARSFVKREIRRKNHYHGIILDPPKYGRGSKGEIWRWEDDIASLLHDIRSLLAEDALFVVLTSYAIRSSFLSLHHIMQTSFADIAGRVDSGELALRETTPRALLLGQAIFARWEANCEADCEETHKAQPPQQPQD